MNYWMGSLVVAGLLSGCAWDNSPTPLHSDIRLHRTGTDPALAAAGTNAVLGGQPLDTNQIQGVGGLVGGGGAGGTGAANTITGTNSAFGSSTAGGRTGTQTTGLSPGVLTGTNSVLPASTSPLNGGLNSANPAVGPGSGGVTPGAGTVPNNSPFSQPTASPSAPAGATGTAPAKP